MRPGQLLTLDEIADRLERVLELATPDATEIAWIETSGGEASSEQGDGSVLPLRRTVMIRVREGARYGTYATGSPEPGEILAAVRQAVAASRAAEPLRLAGPWTEPPGDAAEPADDGEQNRPRARRTARRRGNDGAAGLWDDRLGQLEPDAAHRSLTELADHSRDSGVPGARLGLDWRRLRVVVRTTEGLDRRAEATAATFSATVSSLSRSEGRRPTGRAASAARSLDGLAAESVIERAHARVPDIPEEVDAAAIPLRTDGPLVFSQEAAAALVSILVHRAFASSSFESERSPLTGLLGEHVFASAIDLVDDPLDPAGLSFPFDLLGRSAARIGLIEAGVPRTPAVDGVLAMRLQLPMTPHALGPKNARPTHPFLLAHHGADEVLAAADGGLWIGGFETLECFDPGRVAVRGRCRGVRRVRGGALAEPVAPVLWEDSLLRLFSKVAALGGEPVVRMEDGGLGGVSAPLVCVEGAEALRPA